MRTGALSSLKPRLTLTPSGTITVVFNKFVRCKHTPAIGRKRRAAVVPKKKEAPEDLAINWYPGHIAKAEKELADFLKKVDVVVEVRDARIPTSTTHPSVPTWVGPHKTVIVVMLRIDQTSPRSLSDWKAFYRQNPPYPHPQKSLRRPSSNPENRNKVYFIDGKRGKGNIAGLRKQIMNSGMDINKKRQSKGMQPRPVRAAVIGFPNVGKSSLINRLLGRKLAKAQNVAGFTRKLQWVRMSGKQDGTEPKSHMSIEMLDSPGIIPASQLNKKGAMRLAICNDIGAAAYDHTQAAAALCDQLNAIALERKGYVSIANIKKRYGIPNFEHMCGEDIVHELAARKYDDQVNAAADVLLSDFRKGQLGLVGLEIPPEVYTPPVEDGDSQSVIRDSDIIDGGGNSSDRGRNSDDGGDGGSNNAMCDNNVAHNDGQLSPDRESHSASAKQDEVKGDDLKGPYDGW